MIYVTKGGVKVGCRDEIQLDAFKGAGWTVIEDKPKPKAEPVETKPEVKEEAKKPAVKKDAPATRKSRAKKG